MTSMPVVNAGMPDCAWQRWKSGQQTCKSSDKEEWISNEIARASRNGKSDGAVRMKAIGGHRVRTAPPQWGCGHTWYSNNKEVHLCHTAFGGISQKNAGHFGATCMRRDCQNGWRVFTRIRIAGWGKLTRISSDVFSKGFDSHSSEFQKGFRSFPGNNFLWHGKRRTYFIDY